MTTIRNRTSNALLHGLPQFRYPHSVTKLHVLKSHGWSGRRVTTSVYDWEKKKNLFFPFSNLKDESNKPGISLDGAQTSLTGTDTSTHNTKEVAVQQARIRNSGSTNYLYGKCNWDKAEMRIERREKSITAGNSFELPVAFTDTSHSSIVGHEEWTLQRKSEQAEEMTSKAQVLW